MNRLFDCEIVHDDGEIGLGQRLNLSEIFDWIRSYDSMKILEINIMALEESEE